MKWIDIEQQTNISIFSWFDRQRDRRSESTNIDQICFLLSLFKDTLCSHSSLIAIKNGKIEIDFNGKIKAGQRTGSGGGVGGRLCWHESLREQDEQQVSIWIDSRNVRMSFAVTLSMDVNQAQSTYFNSNAQTWLDEKTKTNGNRRF